MSGLKYLLDSTIVIDHFNGVPQSDRYILGINPKETALSVVTVAEVLAGFAQDDWYPVELFFQQYRMLDINYPVSLTAAKLRQIYRFKLPDSFQAALAINHGIKLVTRNSKDFNPKKHPFVSIPYEL